MKTIKQFALIAALFASANAAFAQNQKTEENARKITELEDKISVLEEAIEEKKLKKSVKKYESVNGMGPAASNVYGSDGFTFGGYAEVTAVHEKSPYKKSMADAQRLIFYSGYRFNDWIVFNSEIEFEHGGFERTEVVTEADLAGAEKSEIEKSKVAVEFAYADFEFNDAFTLRTGLNLVPIGMTNYMHEPTTFYSVQRPLTESTIIPTTWRELGIFAQGDFFKGRLHYRTGIMSGLDAGGFTEEDWIGEDGSFRGSEAELVNPAAILNLEWKPFSGFLAGASYYAGGAGQGDIHAYSEQERIIRPGFLPLSQDEQLAADLAAVEDTNRPRTSVPLQITEAHAAWKGENFEFKALYAKGWMKEDDVRAVNRATGSNIGISAEGGYIEAAFNLLSFAKTSQKLMLFVRDERVNTQRSTVERRPGGREDVLDAFCEDLTVCRTTAMMPDGNLSLGIIENEDPYREMYGVFGTANRTNDRTIVTAGLAYFPHPNVVLKLEYAANDSSSDYHRDIELFNPDNNKIDQINFGLGVIW